LIGEQESIS